MSHLDRLRELVYTSPSGREFRPLWDSLERSASKKAAVHEIPQSDLADVQDLGSNATRWPMSLYFIGPDYDTTADKFFDALGERGRGKLKHPRWGDLDVLPLSRVQTEDLVGDLRAARFQVEFIHAPDLSLVAATNTAAAIQGAADDAAAQAAGAGDQLTASNASDLAKMKDKVVKRVKATARKLKTLSNSVDETREAIEAQSRAIERGIDTLVNLPLELAQDVLALARLPARLTLSVKDKADAYSALITDAVTSITGLTISPAVAAVIDLVSLIIAMCEAVTEGALATRGDAVKAHDTLVSASDQVQGAIDYLAGRGYIPDPVLLAMLADLRARAASYLLASAYTLPAERTITLEAAATPLELAHLLLGDSSRADELIGVNGWVSDMVLVVPAGTEVRYYG